MAETPSPAPLVRANPTRTNAASPWREALILEFGIHPLAEPPPPDRSILWTTRCAATKSSTGQGLPHELYHSRITGPFYRFVAQHGLRYGVLSDLYGLHLDRERLDAYDVHPSALSPERKRELGRIVGAKARAEGFQTLVFVNNSPIRSRPYFQILASAGIEVRYATRVLPG